jgi:hypothetical protein
MRIAKTRVRAVAPYLKGIARGSKFRIGFPANATTIAKAGFQSAAKVGDTILPTSRGPVSTFNSDGQDVVRKDLPKEKRYVRTVFWRWREWAGRGRYVEREDYRDLYRDCYPRDHVPGPGAELTVVQVGTELFLVSEEFENSRDNFDRATHVVNLFLELFGSCELLAKDLRRIAPPEIRRASWRLLPPGEYPWERLKSHIARAVARASDDTERVIWNRQETLQAHGPNEIFVGQGGFDDYLAYVFRDYGIVVLESVRKDNAIYVFGSNWQVLSQLSKSEILRGGRHTARIVHSRGWKTKLAALLKKAA